MIKRDTPRETKSDFVITIRDIQIDCRYPFPLYTAQVITALQQIGSVDTDIIDDRLVDSWRIIGAGLGYCWNHRDYDLEADKNLPLKSYGTSVMDELWEQFSLSIKDFAELFQQFIPALLNPEA